LYSSAAVSEMTRVPAPSLSVNTLKKSFKYICENDI